MNCRTAVLSACLVVAVAGVGHAQDAKPVSPVRPPAAPAPPVPPTAPAPTSPPAAPVPPRPAVAPAAPGAPAALVARRVGQPVNVRVEVTIADLRAGAPEARKTISVVTGDGLSSLIRTQADYSFGNGGPVTVPLNIDVQIELLANDKIRLLLNLQYDVPDMTAAEQRPPGQPRARSTQIRENLGLILENGKTIVASQSADPVNDRQVTVEVKATILR
jgi:hypothetical protein